MLLTVFMWTIYFSVVVANNSPQLGGTLLALTGKGCAVLAVDSRFNIPGSNVFVGQFPRKVFKVGKKNLVGCYGLDGDINALVRHMRQKLGSARIMNSQATPELVSSTISNILYNNPLMAVPIVVGMSSSTGLPWLYAMDTLGALCHSNHYLAIGTSAPALLTNCERLYSPNLQPHQLVALAKYCLKSSLQRDSLSGGNLRVLTLLEDGRIYETSEELNPV